MVVVDNWHYEAPSSHSVGRYPSIVITISVDYRNSVNPNPYPYPA